MILPVGFRKLFTALALVAAGTGSAPTFADAIDTPIMLPVTLGSTSVGVFEVDVYEAVYGDTSFGIGIGGSFSPSSTYALPAGYEYRWIQTVSTTMPAYEWQEPGEVYVDRTREPDPDAGGALTLARSNTPFYADGEGEAGSPPTLQFADNPSRTWGTDQDEFRGTWALSLVAVQAPLDPGHGFNQPEAGVTRSIYQIATFLWGFDASKQPDGSTAIQLGTIEQVSPDPAALAEIFASDPDSATFGNGAWDIRAGLPDSSPGVVPEPSSYLLALSALVAAGVPIHRARRRLAA
jgi:hypothetical protein